MPSSLERFYVYVDKKKADWVKKQMRKSGLPASKFFGALIEDKMKTDEDFCPSPVFVNLSGENARKK